VSAGGRTALITGGASGIGLRLAELLAARGERVAIVDRTPAPEVAARLGGGAVALTADVRDADAVAAAFAAATAALGPPRLVVNCAGVQLGKPFAGLTAAEFERVIAINLLGSRHVAAAALPHLDGGGHLVLVASLAGLVPNYGYAAYCASKYGVVGLAEVLRLEGRPRGITVSCVCPPEVETPMVDEERRTELAPTRALKDLAGTMDLEPAARAILAGIDRGAFLIVPSPRARATRALSRLVPQRLTHAISDRVVARALR
jgi:NAD(P)-dependent dehydrogenase (short-subunit alcohol dehydrogenase family)